MNATIYFVTIVIAGLATYLTRFPGLLLGRVLKTVPRRIDRGLKYTPIGIFAALVAPPIFHHPAFIHGRFDYPFFAASALALITAWWKRNPFWTMFTAVVAIAVFRAI